MRTEAQRRPVPQASPETLYAPLSIRKRKDLGPATKQAYYTLLTQAGGHAGDVATSLADLAAEYGVSRQAAVQWIEHLQRLELVEVIEHGASGRMLIYVYGPDEPGLRRAAPPDPQLALPFQPAGERGSYDAEAGPSAHSDPPLDVALSAEGATLPFGNIAPPATSPAANVAPSESEEVLLAKLIASRRAQEAQRVARAGPGSDPPRGCNVTRSEHCTPPISDIRNPQEETNKDFRSQIAKSPAPSGGAGAHDHAASERARQEQLVNQLCEWMPGLYRCVARKVAAGVMAGWLDWDADVLRALDKSREKFAKRECPHVWVYFQGAMKLKFYDLGQPWTKGTRRRPTG